MRTGDPATTTHAITQRAHSALSLENLEVAAARDCKCLQRVGLIRAQPIPSPTMAGMAALSHKLDALAEQLGQHAQVRSHLCARRQLR